MRAVIVAVLVSLCVPAHATAMTIDEAYQAIPHKRTIFDGRAPDFDPGELLFLREFFEQVDLAMVARVQTLMWFQSAGGRGAPLPHYEAQIKAVLDHLKGMAVPVRLTHVHRLVVEAIQEQHRFFVESQAAREQGRPFEPRYASHPLVKTASHKLVTAYNVLIQLYPNATAHNKQAFFDYLCALDFI